MFPYVSLETVVELAGDNNERNALDGNKLILH